VVSVLGTILLRTLSRLHICAALAFSQTLSSVIVIVARPTVPQQQVFPKAECQGQVQSQSVHVGAVLGHVGVPDHCRHGILLVLPEVILFTAIVISGHLINIHVYTL